VTYLVGYRHLPSRVDRATSVSRKLTAGEWRRIGAICAVLAIVVFHATSYFQSFNTAAIWSQDHVALDLGGFRIPVPWFNAVDPVFSILAVPGVFAVWRWQAGARRGVEPGDLEKIGMGAWLVASGNLILVAAILAFGNDRLSPLWPFLYFAMMGVSFLFYWPVTLALVSRAAPAPVNATMMGWRSSPCSSRAISWAASAGSMNGCRPRCSGACTPPLRRQAAWRCSCSAERLRAVSGTTASC